MIYYGHNDYRDYNTKGIQNESKHGSRYKI